MNYKKITYSALSLFGLGVLGVGIASAQGMGMFGGMGNLSPDEIATHQQSMFDHQAQILGISVDEVKDAWADGKTMQEIIREKGLSETDIQNRIKDMRTQEMTSHLQALVDKGVITQDQMNRRLETMQNFEQNGRRGFKMKMFGHGFGPGFGEFNMRLENPLSEPTSSPSAS
jgi:hypothetical protein